MPIDARKLLSSQIRHSLGVGLLVLAGLAATLVLLRAFQSRHDEATRHTREVSRLAREAQLLATDRNTAVRGFLLTQNPGLLEPDLRARAPLAAVLDSLRTRTRVPEQRERVARIIEGLARWDRDFATPAVTGRLRSGARGADLDTLDAADKPLFDPVRSEFRAFLAEEEQLYQRAAARRSLVGWLSSAVLLFELAVLGLILVRFQRQLTSRASQVEEQQVQLEEQAMELEEQAVELEQQTEELTDANQELAAEKRLAETERVRQRALLDGLAVGVVLIDAELGIVAANPSAERILGLSAERLRDQPLVSGEWRTVREDGTPLPPEEYPASVALRTGEPQRGAIIGVKRTDGGLVWLSVNAEPIPNEHGAHSVVASFTDITHERKLQQQLVQAQKMEAVGQLAGGVAHDFNNLLTAITSYTQLALEQLPPEATGAAEDLEEIRGAANRAATLTRQLLAFSRKQLLQPEVLDLRTVVSGVSSMLSRLIGEDIDLQTNASPELWRVKADPGQLEQVLTNLVVNARDAMPTGGLITIETTNTTLDHEYASRTPGVAPGDYVLISVTDTGTGMDRETQARIFEPFFTTKERGKGTGLGLSTVYGIVKQSGGHIAVYSEVGRGTTFRIYLPREREALSTATPKRATSPLRGGEETVLLVEDDPAVRTVTERMLARLGYTVLPAPGPEAARLIASHHSGPIPLLLCDLVLPQISGRALAEELTERRQEMRVLFMSGYTDDTVIRRGLLSPGMAFLPKPFTLDDLAEKMRRVLDTSYPSPKRAIRDLA